MEHHKDTVVCENVRSLDNVHSNDTLNITNNSYPKNGRHPNICPKPGTVLQEMAGKFDPLRMLDFKLSPFSVPVTQPDVSPLSSLEGQNVRTTSMCNTCGKWFRSRQQLTQHMLVHTDVRKYRCNFCGRAFKQPSHLQQHHRIHTGEKPYKCTLPGCNRAFPQLSNLNHHLRNHDKPEPPRENTCSICDRVYASETVLRNHVLKIHMMSSDSIINKDHTSYVKKKKTDQQHITSNECISDKLFIANQLSQLNSITTNAHAPPDRYQLAIPTMSVAMTTSGTMTSFPVTFHAPVRLYTHDTLIVSPAAPVHKPLQITSMRREDVSALKCEIVTSDEQKKRLLMPPDSSMSDLTKAADDKKMHSEESNNLLEAPGNVRTEFGEASPHAIFDGRQLMHNTISLAKIRESCDSFVYESQRLKTLADGQEQDQQRTYVYHSGLHKGSIPVAGCTTHRDTEKGPAELEQEGKIYQLNLDKTPNYGAGNLARCNSEERINANKKDYNERNGDLYKRSYTSPYNYTLDAAYDGDSTEKETDLTESEESGNGSKQSENRQQENATRKYFADQEERHVEYNRDKSSEIENELHERKTVGQVYAFQYDTHLGAYQKQGQGGALLEGSFSERFPIREPYYISDQMDGSRLRSTSPRDLPANGRHRDENNVVNLKENAPEQSVKRTGQGIFEENLSNRRVTQNSRKRKSFQPQRVVSAYMYSD